VGGLGVGWFN